jgi:peptide/nickel transport system ATP-binding protein
MKQPLVKIQDLYKDYPLPKRYLFQKAPVFRALHGINLELQRGESFGIVGESGCGKSTLARIVMALDPPTAGTVFLRVRIYLKYLQPASNRPGKISRWFFRIPTGP